MRRTRVDARDSQRADDDLSAAVVTSARRGSGESEISVSAASVECLTSDDIACLSGKPIVATHIGDFAIAIPDADYTTNQLFYSPS